MDGMVLGKPKRSRKRLVLAMVVIFVIIIVIFAAVFLKFYFNNKPLAVKGYVSQYINLLVGGEKKDEDTEQDYQEFEKILNKDALERSRSKNIYNISHYSDPSSEKTIKYYNELMGVLREIKESALGGAFSNEEKEKLELLVDDSSSLISLYFMATALAYTNGSYNYFMAHNTLDGFLADYGYPMGDFSDDTVMQIFNAAIVRAYNSKKIYYETIMDLGCIKNKNGESYIDSTCLDINAKIEDMNKKIIQLQRGLGSYSDKILDLIAMNAINIDKIIIDEGLQND